MSREEQIKEFLDLHARANAQLDQLQSNLDEQKKLHEQQQDSIDKIRAHWQYLKMQALGEI